MNKQAKIWHLLLVLGVFCLVMYCTRKPEPQPDTIKPIQDKIDTVYVRQESALIEAEQHSYQQVKKADRITKQAKEPIVIPDTTDAYVREYLINYKHQEYE